MPIIKLYHSGLTSGIPPMKKNHNPSKRGKVLGWSASASKRNVAFLRSVRPDSLTGDAYALTLTIKNCPETSDDWHRIRRAFIERLRRRGLIRFHWVTEWQRRGVPHLHGMAFFEHGKIDEWQITKQWLAVASKYVCVADAQHIAPVTDTLGWFKYLSKHSARGHFHYQREWKAIPRGWEKTGRVWGHVGDWQTDEPITLDLDNQAFYAFRRIVRYWRIADARSSYISTKNGRKKDVKRIISARTMLKSGQEDISRLRGVSEWISMDVALTICDYLRAQGYQVNS